MSNVDCRTIDRSAVQGSTDFVRRMARLPAAILDTLLCWQDRAAERRRLAGMDDWMLRDIGISRADAEGEAAIPFWRAR
jgi:uncharacterized protein YjiS (DUF1127 family)